MIFLCCTVYTPVKLTSLPHHTLAPLITGAYSRYQINSHSLNVNVAQRAFTQVTCGAIDRSECGFK